MPAAFLLIFVLLRRTEELEKVSQAFAQKPVLQIQKTRKQFTLPAEGHLTFITNNSQ
ncbi:MAG: hypothetical protein ACI8RT_000123 [Candidatus Azotimanducaceae bacterium]